ncbi:chromosome segregation protein SMC [Candidatus Woesearchaeota archaeon]|nr:chromosome segregation protein SMC [Candidatus Woesearchaeota archaeon]
MEEQSQQVALEEKKEGKLGKGTKINRIVMNGFKSFAKHTEFLFNGSFNCVLGPNGSGKSNVLDALCFVLGKSSAKSLRAEKSSNLIYNGGKAKKPAKSGEVSIFFDNANKIFPTEEEEVKITRTVRQNGQSVYKINDEARTRQEILDLLGIARINPDAYNIILQGDIIKLVEMHPNERRELIGEIAGISLYEEKKHKAILELEKVDERLKETEIVLSERNTYLKELKKDRDQALKYKDMNDQIRVNKASYLKLQIARKEKERNEVQQKLEEANKELEKINTRVEELKNTNREKREDIDKITKEIEEKGEVGQVSLNKEVETLKIELARKNSRTDGIKSELAKLGQRRNDLKEGIKELQGKIKQIEEEKKEMVREIEEKKKERNSIANRIKEFKEKNKLDNIGEIEKRVEEIDKMSEVLEKEVHEARERQHTLIREKDRITHEVTTIDAQMSKVLDIEKEHKKHLQELESKRKEFKESTLELNKKLDEDSNFAAQLSTARRKANTKEEDLSKLKTRQISARELNYADIALKRILDLKNKKPGIYGTVSELGNVDSKYALALEIAAGPKIKSIVVEDDRTASECIKYLKDNKLGVVTFLPLNKLSSKPIDNETKSLSKSNGSHGLALDLAGFDVKFKKVFEYVFADTIVVDNIDVARRLGIGHAKYVTLDGDLAEKSGAMIGGYRLKRKHSMGFQEKDIAEEIEKNGKELDELKSTIELLEKRRTENEGLIAGLRVRKAALEGEIIKTEKSLHLDTTDLDASKGKRDTLQKYEDEVDGKIKLVQDKISSLNRELALVKTEKQKLRASIAELRNPALLAELNAFEEKHKQLNEELIKIDSEIKIMDTQSEKIYKNELEKTDKILKQIEKDEHEFNREMQNLINEIKSKEDELQKKEALVQNFYAKFKELFHKRSEIDRDIQKNDNLISNKQSESRNVEIRANTLSLKHAEMQAALAGLEQEFSQYEGVKLDLEKNEEQLKGEISKFERMREQIGSVNMRALEIYEDVENEYRILLEKKERLGKEKEDVLKMMEEIEGKKKGLFMRIFDAINANFQKFFTMLTTKGAQATLVIEDEENPFEAGVRINVKITGSKFLDIRSLSGGEKTMTALAFIFAIQEHEPASFYVLDEVDAALDKHNSQKFAKLIRQYSNNAQYVIISHNDAVISEADTLYGVSMNEHGISQVVSLRV